MKPQDRYRIFGRDGLHDRFQWRDLIRQGEVTSSTDLCLEGSEEWKAASNYPELQRYLSLAVPQQQQATSPSAISKELLIAVAIIFGGLVVAAIAFNDVFHGVASKQWPTAQASLSEAEVVRVRSWSRSSSGRGYYWYRVHVTYDYTVNGHLYSSRLISFGREWSLTARGQVDAIRKESPNLAHYDPVDPSRAVLHPGITYGATKWFLIGLASMGFGTLLATKPALAKTALSKSSAVIRLASFRTLR